MLDQFWISRDGTIVSQSEKSAHVVDLTVAFSIDERTELPFLSKNLSKLQFTERSRLARVGLEVSMTSQPVIRGNTIHVRCEAFAIDPSFPTFRYFRNLLREGTAVGRLFYAPESEKLTSNEIWDAVKDNRIKLPNTVSIDRFGKVYFTPHRVRYLLPPNLPERELAYLISGDRPRSYLDKVQIREAVKNLSLPPGGGILSSCSMYLPEHYVVLRRSEDKFGIHTGAVLLDPGKTFGTNIMLEIYNASDQFVLNPVVAIDIYRAGSMERVDEKTMRSRRETMYFNLHQVYERMETGSHNVLAKPSTADNISVRWESPWSENESIVLPFSLDEPRKSPGEEENLHPATTVSSALKKKPEDADTLVLNFFPNLSEHIEILGRSEKHKLRRLVFKKASRTHNFFLPNSAHAQMETYEKLGIEVYWYNEEMGDLFRHVYKKSCGFFVRDEKAHRFQATTLLAFYGSGVTLSKAETTSIENLLNSLIGFFGSSIGILTGGGPGVMEVATTAARKSHCLTGACFLELEAQEDILEVDYFNSFQETNRHNRQKWFEVADFCIFNIGGVGTLEEAGIELCNLKLGIRPRTPLVFYNDAYWQELKNQILHMVETGRTPSWIPDYLLFTSDPEDVVDFYREKLQLL